MPKRTMLMAAVVTTMLASTVTLASLYSWNDAKRPPISLADALARAEKLLGDDAANRYCVDISLYGDKAGEGKEGAWNFLFAAADGSRKHVYIDMQGKSDVTLWNGPIDWKKIEGRRTDLDDVRRRLEDVFATFGIKATFEAHEDRFLITYKTREFQVYPQREDGTYEEELKNVSGPEGDGIWLQVRIVEKQDLQKYGYNSGPYWTWMRSTFFTTNPGQFLAVDFRDGRNVKYEMSSQMWKVFGEYTPNGWGN